MKYWTKNINNLPTLHSSVCRQGLTCVSYITPLMTEMVPPLDGSQPSCGLTHSRTRLRVPDADPHMLQRLQSEKEEKPKSEICDLSRFIAKTQNWGWSTCLNSLYLQQLVCILGKRIIIIFMSRSVSFEQNINAMKKRLFGVNNSLKLPRLVESSSTQIVIATVGVVVSWQ